MKQKFKNTIVDETLIAADQATKAIMRADAGLEERRKIACQA
jgi:hypothetical protein